MLIGPKTKRVLALAVCLVLLIGLLPLGAAAATEGNYLYNGVELPALPDYNKTTYPYASIHYQAYEDGTGAIPVLYVSAYTLYVYNGYGYGVNGKGKFQTWWIGDDGEWTLHYSGTITNSSSTVGGPGTGFRYDMVWGNFNIYYDNGNLCIAASDPVSVDAEPSLVVPDVPTFRTNLAADHVYSYDVNATPEQLYVDAYTTDSSQTSNLVYTWQSYVDGQWIDAQESLQTGQYFTPITSVVGTWRYRCLVTNTIGEITSQNISNTVYVVVGNTIPEGETVSPGDQVIIDQVGSIQDGVGQIQEGIEQLPEEIVGGMEQIQEQEKEQASAEGSDLVDDILSVVPNESQAFMDALGSLTDTMSYSGTACKLVIPAVDFPALGDKVPAWRMMEETELDFEQYITMMPEGILLLVRSLLTIALIVYCFKELYDTISYVLTLRKSGGEG